MMTQIKLYEMIETLLNKAAADKGFTFRPFSTPGYQTGGEWEWNEFSQGDGNARISISYWKARFMPLTAEFIAPYPTTPESQSKFLKIAKVAVDELYQHSKR